MSLTPSLPRRVAICCASIGTFLAAMSAQAANLTHVWGGPAGGTWTTGTWTNGTPADSAGDLLSRSLTTSGGTILNVSGVTIGALRNTTGSANFWQIDDDSNHFALTFDNTGWTGAANSFGSTTNSSVNGTSSGGVTLNTNVILSNTDADFGTINANNGGLNVGILGTHSINAAIGQTRTLNIYANSTATSGSRNILINSALGTAGGTLHINSTGTSGASTTTTLAGDLGANVGSLTHNRAAGGFLILTGNNTNYTGTTTLAAGNLQIGSNTALGSGTFNINGGALNTNSATARVLSTFPSAVNVNGDFTFTGTGALNLGGGAVTLGGAGTRTITTTANALTIGGLTDGGNGLIKAGNGTLVWGGTTASSFTGTLTINGGAFNLGGKSGTIGALSSAGGVTIQNADVTGATLTINDGLSASFSGTLTDGAGGGALSLTKAGAGSQTLGGINSYTGATTVLNGTLAIANTIASSTTINVLAPGVLNASAVVGGVTLGSGKTLTGDGTVNGLMTIGSGANLSPGTDLTAGTLSIGSLSLASGAQLNFNLNTTSSYDSVNVGTADAFTIGGGGLNLSGAAAGATGSTFNLFQYNGALQFSGGATINSLSVLSGGVGGLTYTFANDPVNHFVTLTISGTAAQVSTWNAAAGGSWAANGNWSPAIAPSSAGDTANLGSIITAPTTITLDSARSVGTLTFNNANAYTIASGAGGSLTLDNFSNAANVTITSGSHTISAPVTLASNTLVTVSNANDTLTVTNAVNGPAMLTKAGPGTLVLNTANNYSGGTALNAGTLSFVAGGLGTSGALVFGGGTLRYSAGNTEDISARSVTLSGQAVVDTNGNDVNFANPIGNSGASGLTKVGAGKLTVSNGNTFSGGSVITGGTLAISDDSALGVVPLNPATSLTFNAGPGNSATLLANAGIALNANRNIALTSGTAIFDTDFNTVSIPGTISGSGTLHKVGTGTLTLSSAANTYSGGTIVDAGTLTVTSAGGAGALGSGIVTLNNSATLNLGVRAMGQTLIVNGTNTVQSGDNGGVSALMAIAGAGTLNVAVTGANVDMRGDITGFTGTIVPTGNLRFNGTVGGTMATFEMSTGSISMRNTGTQTIDLGAVQGSGGSINGNSNNAGTTTFSIGAKGLSTIFAGAINNGGLANTFTAVTKVGAGSLTLAGTNNYTGVTTVNAGTLLVTGSISGSTTTVNGGTLGGTGTLGAVIVNNAGTFAPGPGIAAITTGNLTLNGTATLAMEMNFAAPNTFTSDLATVGTLSLDLNNTAVLSLTNTGSNLTLDFGSTITLIDYADGGWNTGVFAGRPDDSTFTVFGTEFRISYNGADDATSSVVLVAVPEPGSAAILLAGLGSIVGLRRFRRREE